MTIESSSFYGILQIFASCFTAPSFQNFTTMAVGLVLCRDRHYISQAVRVCVSLGVSQHHSVFYRFFSRARWVPDELGKVLFLRMLRFIAGRLTLIVDDTLCRRTGPHIWGAGMHHDAVASSYGRNSGQGRHVAFAFGHSWVILAFWVPFPWNPDRGVAIPILFRIYRSKKLSPSAEYRKRTVLALELLRVLETWMADIDREVMLVGDSEYSCCTVIKHLPARFHFTGPAVMDAALFSLPPDPPEKRGRGQPRKKGDRLPTPAKILSDPAYPWIKMKVFIYGRTVDIRIKTLICQWYQVAGPRPVRIVITRDPTGRLDDRVYVCTDYNATVEQTLGVFSRRWSLEVTFYNTKQYLGLEHPQNGWGYLPNRRRKKKKPGPQPRASKGQRAVERTVPCVLYLYGLVHLWYFEHGNPKADVARARRLAPWYLTKRTPSFADMLDALRRHLATILEFSQDPVPDRVHVQLPGAPDPLMAAA
jgi:hypothetical protein